MDKEFIKELLSTEDGTSEKLIKNGDFIDSELLEILVKSTKKNLQKAFYSHKGNIPGKRNIEKEDTIRHPSHYCFGKYEPVKVIQDWELSFCLGNVVKYLARAGRKEGNSKLQDLLKAKQYIEFEIEELENDFQEQRN